MTTVTRPSLLSAMAYMLQAAGITVIELAQHMGVMPDAPAVPAVHIATVPRKPRTLSDNDRRVIEAAGLTHGVSVDSVRKLLGIRDAQAHRYCATLTEAGHLTGVKKPGIRAMRFFARPDLARAWAEGNDWSAQPPAPGADPAAAPARVGLSDAELRSIHTSLAKKAGAHKSAPPLGPRTQRKPPRPEQNIITPPKIAPHRLQGEAVETAATRRTVDSTQRPTARWQAAELAPDPRWPSFSSAPLGVNPDTGRPWA